MVNGTITMNLAKSPWTGPAAWAAHEHSSSASTDRFESSAIKTPFGKLVPHQVRFGTQTEFPFAAEIANTNRRPTAGNEIHAPITSKLNFKCLGLDGHHVSDRIEVLRLAAEARDHSAAGITIEPKWLSDVKSYLGPDSILRVQTLIGEGLNSSDSRLAALKQAVAGGADELAVIPDYEALRRGDDAAFGAEARALVEAAGDVPLKLVVDVNNLTAEEVKRAAKLAEQAGVRFLRTDTGLPDGQGPLFGQIARSPRETALLLKEACNLGVEFAGGLESLADCREVADVLKGRRVRFDSGEALKIATQESELLNFECDCDEGRLAAEMSGDEGQGALRERDRLLAHFEDKIRAAHEAGKPVVYLSVPVRANDASGFEQNIANHQALVDTAEKAGVAYVDPFEVEGTPILTNKGISSRAVQELLMDASTGLWPKVLAECDAIAHAPNWRFSTGAREEQMMADVWNIPTWDGKAPLAIKAEDFADDGLEMIR